MPAPEYIPGTCNIGPVQISKRRRITLYALTLFFISTVAIVMYSDSRSLRLLVFIPAVVAGVSGLQWITRFCVYFGVRGIFNAGTGNRIETVEEKAFRRKDLTRAGVLVAFGVLIGALITAGIYFLPA